MNTERHDITTEEDIKKLVDTFYGKVNQDALLSPIFNDLSKVDWEKHLPIMYRFWSTILLGTLSYSGQPFPKHAFLPIGQEHFSQWLYLFHETLTENFKGPVTEDAKLRAANIARIFLNKINAIQGKDPSIPIMKND
jgi:hemoglobin